jgi:hypothetical protein
MDKDRTAGLDGARLDLLVAKAAGKTVMQGRCPRYRDAIAYFLPDGTHYNPSDGGADAAALMQAAGITTIRLFDDQWAAQSSGGKPYYGETEHIAAMRAYVGKVLGEAFSA